MNSAISNLFFKQVTCPSSEALLTYGASMLAGARAAEIREHLADCEFCEAELMFLAAHCPAETEECPAVQMPLDLRHLAEAILKRNDKSVETLAGISYEKEGLTLTDA